MNPGGAQAGVEAAKARALVDVDVRKLENVIEPSKHLSALDRIGIYCNMYYWRLIDCLVEDYPGVRHGVGPDPFYDLVRAYIAARPSTHFSLNEFGAEFADFLRDDAEDLEHREFLVQLATLERTECELFDEPPGRPLTTEELLAVPPDRWAQARLQVVDSLRLLKFEHPVHEYLTRVEQETAPAPGSIPDTLGQRQGVRSHSPVHEPSAAGNEGTTRAAGNLADDTGLYWVVVYRDGYAVRRMELDRQQAALLTAIMRGERLAAALETASDPALADPEHLQQNVSQWFRDWTSECFFAAVQLD